MPQMEIDQQEPPRLQHPVTAGSAIEPPLLAPAPVGAQPAVVADQSQDSRTKQQSMIPRPPGLGPLPGESGAPANVHFSPGPCVGTTEIIDVAHHLGVLVSVGARCVNEVAYKFWTRGGHG